MPTRHQLDESDRTSHPGATRERRSPPTVVRMRGDVDAAALGEFSRHLNAGIGTAVRVLVVDLSKVTFLSIRGAEVLADAQWRAGHDGVELVLVTGGRAVDRTLTVTGLEDRFRRFGSADDAVRQTRRGRALMTVPAPVERFRDAG
ncbi:STAS domain-containing protein [Rhodococcus daqingensis]|uniref:STAS domain-containing protein n=1 Tax=Rhodococcus daqingensis TaxID=2479363 RepID=A0ABW2S1C8_9NOCA